MLGIGYILAFALIIADMLLFSYGGWLLALASILSLFILHGWINKKRFNAYKCEGNAESEQKLKVAFFKIQNKVKNKHKFLPNTTVLLIPGNDANSMLLNWKTIGITEGALRMEPRVLEALIAHEYGRLINGDVFLLNVAMINFFGLFFLLLINNFVFIAIIYLVVVLLFIIGVIRFNLLSVFISERLTSFLRRMCEAILRGIIACSGVIAQMSGKYGQYIADGYAVDLGYGLYLKRYLTYYANMPQGRGTLSPLQNRTHNISKRIIKIDSRMRRQRGA